MGPGFESLKVHHRVGVTNAKGTPVPIPNTEVKLCSAENTRSETTREDRSMPTPARKCGKTVSVTNAKGTPVPIPNTEVKLCSAENTWSETTREDRSTLTYLYSSLAQLAERMTVNHDVAGSSPAGGAMIINP